MTGIEMVWRIGRPTDFLKPVSALKNEEIGGNKIHFWMNREKPSDGRSKELGTYLKFFKQDTHASAKN